MAILVVPNALQVVCSGTNLGTPWVNVFGVGNDGTFLLDQAVADEIGEAFRSSYQGIQSSLVTTWGLDEIQVRDLRTATSPAYDVTFTAFSGSDIEDPMPPQACVVASHKTNQRGASFRGRTYHSGFSESANDGVGGVATSFRAEIQSFYAGVTGELALVTGGPFWLGVISRKLLEINQVITTTVDPEWDRQDRRKRT